MQRVNRLIAFSLLFIMTFVLVHNTIPHQHHSHHDGALVHFHDHHGHDAHHHHSSDPEDSQKKPSLLDFLFNHHTQSLQSYHYTQLTTGQIAPFAKLIVKCIGGMDTMGDASADTCVRDERSAYLARALPDDPHIFFPTDRGPPLFG